MARALGVVAAAAAVAVLVTSCLYDSQWVEHEAEKKRAAARLHPATLTAENGRAGATRVALVRAYATRAYAAETVNWERQFDDLLHDANQVLEPALGLSLENGGTSLWTPEAGEAEPTVALGALVRQDPGDDVAWVAGFLQSVPKMVTDYHTLGVGRYLSKHLVVRGSADPKEMDALGKFEGMSDADRQKIYSERRRHKIVAVFLHELGHTLGAPHRSARDTLMVPAYDSKERGFDDATIGLFKITLPDHLSGAPYRAAGAALAYLEKDDGGWIPSEREQIVDFLKKAAPGTRPTAAGGPSAAGPPLGVTAVPPAGSPAESGPLPFTSMPRSDRAAFDAAVATEKRGDVRAAWDAAAPLFDAHPRVVEVQELRCRLAGERGYMAGVVEAYCERYHALTDKK